MGPHQGWAEGGRERGSERVEWSGPGNGVREGWSGSEIAASVILRIDAA